MLSRHLSTKISASGLRRKFIKSALLVGWKEQEMQRSMHATEHHDMNGGGGGLVVVVERGGGGTTLAVMVQQPVNLKNVPRLPSMKIFVRI